jgi:hypothetical protein
MGELHSEEKPYVHSMRAVEHDHMALIADSSANANKRRNDPLAHQAVLSAIEGYQGLFHGQGGKRTNMLNKLKTRHEGHLKRLTPSEEKLERSLTGLLNAAATF